MNTMKPRTTLLDLVQAVQDHCSYDAEVVAVITHLVNSGRVVLRGTFAGRRIAAA
jgi:hypothetical protein